MASRTSLTLRNTEARRRLTAALDQAREGGADIPQPNFTHRDADVAKAQELEYFADVVELLTQEPTPAPVTATQPAQAPAKAQTPKPSTATQTAATRPAQRK